MTVITGSFRTAFGLVFFGGHGSMINETQEATTTQ